jgi:dUTP pyrophosphatase
LAARHGITIVNSPGTVDAGYRGEIRITILNTDKSMPYAIAVGDRIAQLIVMPVSRARFVPVDTLPESQRGDAGFGSTGYTVSQSGEHA